MESEGSFHAAPRRIWVKRNKLQLIIGGLKLHDWPVEPNTSQEHSLKRKGPPVRVSPRKKQKSQDQDERSNVDVSLKDHQQIKNDKEMASFSSSLMDRLGVESDIVSSQEADQAKVTDEDNLTPNSETDNHVPKTSSLLSSHASQRASQQSGAPSRAPTPLPAKAEDSKPPLRDPNLLLPSDLPPPFLPIPTSPPTIPFEDTAAALLYTTYLPLPPLTSFLIPMTSHPLSTLSITTLTALALNTHRALTAWQDAYIELDRHTAPLAHPPKKPATGGRIPIDPGVWETLKQSELIPSLNYHNPSAPLDTVTAAGRPLRRRRNAEDLLGLPSSTHGVLGSVDAGGFGKRARKPVRRFDVGAARADGVKRGPRIAALICQDPPIASPGVSPTPEPPSEVETEEDSSDAHDDDDDDAERRPRGAGRGGRGGRGRGGARGGLAPSAASASASTSAQRTHARKVKSEKRSESMTAWWAERKRKAAEAKRRGEPLQEGSGGGGVLGHRDEAKEEFAAAFDTHTARSRIGTMDDLKHGGAYV